MCEIKSFEDLLEKYSADEAAEHIHSCSECRKLYGNVFALVYPDIPQDRIRVKHSFNSSLFFKIAPAVAALSLVFIIGVFLLQNSRLGNKANGYSNSITYYDCLEIMDSIGDDEFIEIINNVQEEL